MKRGDFLNKSGISTLPLIVLITGVILAIAVFFASFSPSLFQIEPVETIQEAKEVAEQYISRNFPEMEVEEIMEFSNNYYVIVKEKDTGNAGFELLVDRNSGRVGPEPGPNMMWNTKYAHHRISEPTTNMPVTIEAAEMRAQEWLNKNIPGSEVESTETFYGYYTMDLEEKGEIFGMLSVNGYDGDIWYHSWHGDFISMKEYN